MRRVVILGNSGTGKSTFARKLGERLGLPVIHLDVLYYGPAWAAGDPAAFRERVAQATTEAAWIVDGAFLTLVGDLTLPKADLVLWLEQPRWLALGRALWRCVDPRGAGRADLPSGCRDTPSREMLQDIWTFDRAARSDIERRLVGLGAPVQHLQGDAEIAAFLADAAP
jgi:adenylate kinase family enzyme